jgi:hypothetical protein
MMREWPVDAALYQQGCRKIRCLAQRVGQNGSLRADEAVLCDRLLFCLCLCCCSASEVTEIKLAVSALKDALEGVRSNTDSTRSSMLRLNLKEARDILARRLQETAPGIAPAGTSTDASLSAATREATVLLDEVDAQFFAKV